MANIHASTKKTQYLVKLALLAAIVILMSFTPLGYLRIGPVDITFLPIPIALGAVLLGPAAGATLGALFGITSFIQCFGASAFGALLLGINPFFTFIMCIVPRALTGWLCGLIFRLFSRVFKVNGARSWRATPAFAIASLSAALLNTALFVLSLIVFFGGNNAVLEFFGTTSMMGIIVALITFNALIEAGATLVLGTAIASAVYHAESRRTTHQN